MAQTDCPKNYKTTKETVKNDTSSNLSTLRHQFGKPLTHIIMEICEHNRATNAKSEQFWKNLRCFLPAPNHHKNRGQTATHILETISLKTCSSDQGYVAISYPWNPSDGESKKTGRYELPPSMRCVELARDIVLERAFRFIRYKQGARPMIPLWIDKMSIDQEPSPEKDVAMQTMDLVYKRCEYAIGYLWVEIRNAKEMNRLLGLLCNRFIDRNCQGSYPTFKKGITNAVIGEVLDLLIRITNDQWWDRAWIFQEDYLAGEKMWLLLRHADGLQRPDRSKHLGSLPGELFFQSAKFRQSATLFCLACDTSGSSNHKLKDMCKQILRKAGKYNILYQYSHIEDREHHRRTLTVSILKELKDRHIEKRSDLLPIIANVCGYNLRLLTTGSFSLSIGILALHICNGELFKVDNSQHDLDKTVFDFVADQSMCVESPFDYKTLTLIKHCRLSVTAFSLAGVHTTGILWKLGDTIAPRHLVQGSCSSSSLQIQQKFYKYGLNSYQKRRLSDLCRVLYYRKLHGSHKKLYGEIIARLTRYIDTPRRFKKGDDWPAQHSMNVMAACVVYAMDHGLYLRLARPVRSSSIQGRGMPYYGIFIQSKNALQKPGSTCVFTSWAPTKENIHGDTTLREMAKYVSIEVGAEEGTSGTSNLRSKNWINGLCFFEGEKKLPYTFAWPESLSS